MKVAVVAAVLVVLFAIVAAQVAEDKPRRRWLDRRWGEKRPSFGRRRQNKDGEERSRGRMSRFGGNLNGRIPRRFMRRPVEDFEEEADQRNSFNFNGNLNGVNANYGRTFNNGGQLNLGGNWQRGSGFGVTGGYNREWNGGRTSLGINGGWAQRGGANIGIGFSHRWDDEEESDLSMRPYQRYPRCFCIRAPCDCDKFSRPWAFDEEADFPWIPAISLGVKYGPSVYNWAKDKLKRRDDFDEEADKFNWDKVFQWFGKGKQIYDIIKNRDDFDEEADAEFFRKLGAWFKKNFTPENVQKGLNIYRTIKGGDDMEESDAEFFKKLKGAFGKIGGIAKKGLGLYQQYGGLLRI